MNRGIALALAVSLGALQGAAQAADEKVALVIGNAGYTHAPEVVSALADARHMTRELRRAGYEVRVGANLDRDEMRDALAAFGRDAVSADKAVFFYSGHAMRSDGVTYLAPVDMRGRTLSSVMFDGLALDYAIRVLAETDEGGALFIDAAQLEGFSPRRYAEPGIADIRPPRGVLVVSAAAPGRAIRAGRGGVSSFAGTVARQFLAPGVRAAEEAKRVRRPIWAAGSLPADFALTNGLEYGRDDREDIEEDVERAMWEQAERSDAIAGYRAYLNRFPRGRYADAARTRIARIESGVRVGRDFRLTDDDRRDIQRELRDLGYYRGTIDGIFGGGTARAIRAWQQDEGYRSTGELTPAQAALLLGTTRRDPSYGDRRRDDRTWQETGARGTEAGFRAYLEQFPEGRHAAAAHEGLKRLERDRRAASRAEREAWRRAENSDNIRGYRRYLAGYAGGTHAAEARKRIARLEEAARRAEAKAAAERSERDAWRRAAQADTRRSYRRYLNDYPRSVNARKARERMAQIEEEARLAEARAAAERTERALGLDARDRRSVERRLRRLGYEIGDVGRPDGDFEPRTRRSIARFQQDIGERSTGYLDRPTVVALVRRTRLQRPDDQVGRVIREFFNAVNQ